MHTDLTFRVYLTAVHLGHNLWQACITTVRLLKHTRSIKKLHSFHIFKIILYVNFQQQKNDLITILQKKVNRQLKKQ